MPHLDSARVMRDHHARVAELHARNYLHALDTGNPHAMVESELLYLDRCRRTRIAGARYRGEAAPTFADAT